MLNSWDVRFGARRVRIEDRRDRFVVRIEGGVRDGVGSTGWESSSEERMVVKIVRH